MVPSHLPHKIPILVTNESEQTITLTPLSVIAEITMSPQILSQSVSVDTQQKPEVKLELDFINSPIFPEWKDRVISKLEQMPDVFSQHNLDFGCTDHVKHHIRLHDETPFKQRARPIHPRDIEAVSDHLLDLLEAGVIRESPFS